MSIIKFTFLAFHGELEEQISSYVKLAFTFQINRTYKLSNEFKIEFKTYHQRPPFLLLPYKLYSGIRSPVATTCKLKQNVSYVFLVRIGIILFSREVVIHFSIYIFPTHI